MLENLQEICRRGAFLEVLKVRRLTISLGDERVDVDVIKECSMCGACCRFKRICVTEDEAKQISQYLGVPMSQFLHEEMVEICGNVYRQLVLNQNPDESCIFLGRDNRCRIYPVRPFQCKTYPILFIGSALELLKPEILPDGTMIFWCVTKECAYAIKKRDFIRFSEARTRYLAEYYMRRAV